jgi:hypothetical protein
MRQITIDIPAAGAQPGVATIHASGKYFLLTALTAAVEVLTSNNDEYSFDTTGSGFGDDLSQKFGALTFYNNSGLINTVNFYVSDSPIKLPDVNLTSSVNVTTQMTNTLANCALAALADFLATAAAANVANAFKGVSTQFRKCTVLAFKAFGVAGAAPTANVGIVFIGISLNRQPIALNPGDVWTFEAPTGSKYDFDSFYISAPNAGDGVLVIYS